MKNRFLKKYIPIILFLFILLLGIFLRFYRMKELGTFLADQAIELGSTAQILAGKFTLLGIKTSISDIHNGAVMYYVTTPFLYLFNYSPIAGGITQTTLQILTIIIVFVVLNKLKLINLGLITCFLISTSPLLVRYSRQTMLAYYPLFFSTIIFIISIYLSRKFSRLLTLLLGFMLGLSLQVHFSTLSLVIFTLFFPFLFLSKKNRGIYFLLLLTGLIIGFLPMIFFELRHQFFQTKMLLALISNYTSHQASSNNFNLIQYWQDTISQLLFAGNVWMSRLYLLGLFIGLCFYRKSLCVIEKLSLLQIISTLIFTILLVRGYTPHYAITLFVPLFILSSSFIVRIRVCIPKIIYSFVISCLFVLFILINYPMYGLSDNHGWTMTEGWNLTGVEKAAGIILQDVKSYQMEGKYNVAMVADAQNQGLPLRYFLEVWKIPPLPYDKYDKAETLYVVTEPGIDLSKIDMWEITSFGPSKIVKVWPLQNGFQLSRLEKKSNINTL